MTEEERHMYLSVPLAFIITALILFIAYKIEKKNYCNTPYHQVCVEHHIEQRLTPLYLGVGVKMKVGRTTMTLRPVQVCDKYETQLKSGCEK